MKLNDFLNSIFGTNKSADEFNQLQEWKNAGELNAQMLQEMSELHKDTNDLQNYQMFDVESALTNTMERANETSNKSNWTLKILLGTVIIGTALFLYSFLQRSNTPNVNQIIASSQQEIYEKSDGSQFLINTGATLSIDENTNTYSLVGEAFFHVEEQEKPLTIATNHGNITVLGTSFNVITTSEFTEVFMFDGTISFDNMSEDSAVNVTKGQCIIAKSEGNKIVNDLSDQAFAYWRTNTLTYNNTALSTVLADLKKIFQHQMEHKDQYDDIIINSTFVNNSYDQIIDELQVITGLNLK